MVCSPVSSNQVTCFKDKLEQWFQDVLFKVAGSSLASLKNLSESVYHSSRERGGRNNTEGVDRA